MDMSYLQQYVDKNQLLDLTPYIEDGTLDMSNLSEDAVNMGKVGDKIYGVAVGSSVRPVCSIIKHCWKNWVIKYN